MSAMTKKEWMEYLEKIWDAAQREAWSEPQFECPRCGHCCQAFDTEQEPVAWTTSLDFDDDDQEIIPAKDKGKLGTSNCDIPLYTEPKRWVGLKDEQVEDEWERITGHSIFGGDRSEGRAMYISPDEVIEFSRAIESKLKEKNT